MLTKQRPQQAGLKRLARRAQYEANSQILVMTCSYDRHGGFGIWAVRWSADGREILAGTGDSSLYVYDMTEHKVRVAAPKGLRVFRILTSFGISLLYMATGCPCCSDLTV
jgi:WD40 repeat protein